MKKLIIYIFMIVFIFLFLNNNLSKVSIKDSNSEFINKLFNLSNLNTKYEKKDNLISVINYVNDIQIKNPITIIDKAFAYEYDDSPKIYYMQNKVPRVYIYSTHQDEKYADNKSVIDASLLLQEKLNSLGIETLVESKSVKTYLLNNNTNKNYLATRAFLTEQLEKYDFDLVIDLHRDAGPASNSTKTTIDEKNYAKIMFVMNKNYENISFAKKFNNIISTKYKTLSRGIYDRYIDSFNQDLTNKAVLIEVGSDKNTFEEVTNTIDALAISIKELLNEK